MTSWTYLLLAVLVAVPCWYGYQVASRKTGRVKYKIQLVAVYLTSTAIALLVLRSEGFTTEKAGLIAVLAGVGVAYIVVKPPKRDRRIPKAIREAVIDRDLTSKGLQWDPKLYHIDHIIPFSKGGDHSLRNLRVMPRGENLSKGAKMPGLRDFRR